MEIITEQGEHFDIPTDQSFDFEFINPMLSEVGSQTLPCTLPYTPRNLRLLEHPNRYDRAKKYTIKRNVTLRQGTFVKRATQAVFKANETDKIVSSFYLDEAIFYERIKTMKLSRINYEIDPAFPSLKNPSVQVCMNVISDVMALTKESNFHVFPILTKFGKHINAWEVTTNSEILNMYDKSGVKPKIKDWSSRDETIDGVKITYPAGYGITIFLKVGFVIDSIAKHLGYKVKNNIFNTGDELKHLVLVNNVADTIVKGYVDYTQLVPDIPVSDFIICLKNKFGIVMVVNEIIREIRLETFDSILKTRPDFDLSPYTSEIPKIEWGTPKQVKLSAGTSFPFSKPEVELYEDFIKAHGEPVELNALNIILNTLTHDSATNSFLMFSGESTAADKRKETYLSSSNFDFYTKDQIEEETFKSKDEQLALAALLENLGPDSTGVNQIDGYLTPILNGRRNLNSTLYLDNEKQADEENSTPIIFCFCVPELGNTNKTVPVGTPYSTGFGGKKWGNLSLAYHEPEGLYNTFWKTFDSCLRNSFNLLTCKLNLPLHRLQMLNIYTPKLLFNQPVLIEKIKCKIGNEKFEITEATFRTIRQYIE